MPWRDIYVDQLLSGWQKYATIFTQQKQYAIRKCYVRYWFCELQHPVRQYSWFLSLLFLIHVNDMASSIDSNYKLILYAEDRFYFLI